MFTSEECVVCMDSDSAQKFVPCNHACCCSGCAKKIIAAKMDCPLCRAPIANSVITAKIIADSAEVKVFEERKSDYIAQLNQRCAKNAGYIGKSKLARGVGREMGDAMEELVKERAGEQRYSAKVDTFTIVRGEMGNGDSVRVAYKMGKKMWSETVPYFEWEFAKSSFVDEMAGDTITALAMASHYPEHYWLWKFHRPGPGLEEALQESGLLQTKRRR